MIDQQYYDDQSDHYFSDLGELAEHYDDDSDHYSISGLPSEVYVCELRTIKFGDAASKARGLLSDFLFEQRSPEYYSLSKTTARNIAQGRTENFYYGCDTDETPPIKGIEDLQRSLNLFTAINKPFWRLGGDCMIGLWFLDRALRKIEKENADVHRLWYPTRERIELTDRVWESLKLENWKMVDGEWEAIA
jgi:hypothetical protein